MDTAHTTDRPQPGDLVLTWDGQCWNISVHPGPAQLRATDLFAAIEQARPLAEHGKVDLWSTRDGIAFSKELLPASKGRSTVAGSGRS